ncbi:MAG: TMEM165/GDT1 family protein [Actinobacteria bacterium]|nr:TMEM165/GDT1 family protein [Actinomycetota bacterium]
MLRNSLIVFIAIFLAELPDKTMFATLMLSTRMRRPLAVWIGVCIGYCTHVTVAVLFGSALSKLPERPIHAVVGLVFLGSGIFMFRSSTEHQESDSVEPTQRKFFQVIYLSATTILVAEFADMTQLATVGFAVRTGDSLGVAIGAASALCTVSAIAVVAGSWLQRNVKLHLVQRMASLLFIILGFLALLNSIFSST